ncbi:hypothetical protein X777_09674 [Ooceraea biroi]|uniref:Uncharacterized protein n=1 Tax=Ooceraea biroi TaxID=2015173 RepID=A0A026W5Q9_OOCBI|nr:hypothetical protein X777_09674 [Ooceraea biroi]
MRSRHWSGTAEAQATAGQPAIVSKSRELADKTIAKTIALVEAVAKAEVEVANRISYN